MVLKYKKLSPDAIAPRYANFGDAGLDLVAISMDTSNPKYIEYHTGLAFEFPSGYVGLLFPRSSISKYDLVLANCVGVLDSGYRGEITFRYRRLYKPVPIQDLDIYSVGSKIGQLVILEKPTVLLREEDDLEVSERGVNGYGSSGS